MKTIFAFSLIIFICSLFSSCQRNISTSYHYYRSFFLGEKSFEFEGEIKWDFKEHYLEDYSIDSFDFVTVRIRSNSDNYHDWKIAGIKIIEDKFQLLIDTMANGVDIEKLELPNGIYRQTRFPKDFPAYELQFLFFNEENTLSRNEFSITPDFSELKYPSRKSQRYRYYSFTYIYVAEPIDLSGTEIFERDKDDSLWHSREIKHYDLNFSKAGWYKIVESFTIGVDDGEIDNDPNITSGKNNWF